MPIEIPLQLEIFEKDIKATLLDPIEIYASKINALCSRAAARDLYDVDRMIETRFVTDLEMLRKCVLFYALLSNNGIENVFCYEQIENMPFSKIKRDLLPVLSDKSRFDLENKKKSIIQFLQKLMILTQNEQEFISFFKKGIYRPDLLFHNDEIIKRIQNHPLIKWRLMNK